MKHTRALSPYTSSYDGCETTTRTGGANEVDSCLMEMAAIGLLRHFSLSRNAAERWWADLGGGGRAARCNGCYATPTKSSSRLLSPRRKKAAYGRGVGVRIAAKSLQEGDSARECPG
uniref:Uncharacterized protein n=1 Tax=Plectus sambesii TaxID=2011161 RepID=A0A914XP54_9BILA